MADVTPVILDTDIGLDIDDHWAIALLLSSAELDVRLITVSTGDTEYRAELAAGLLTAADRTDIPIGVGPESDLAPIPDRIRSRVPDLPEVMPRIVLPIAAAAGHLAGYDGPVTHDGAGAMVEAIMGSPDPVTLITIGPLTTVAAALAREPRIASRSRLIAMAGDFGGDDGSPWPEYNVFGDAEAFARVLDSDWRITLAPIDTAARIVLDGDRFQRLRGSRSPLMEAVFRDYREWHRNQDPRPSWIPAPDAASTSLCDALAVHLAYDETNVDLVGLRVNLDDENLMLVPSQRGRPVRAAWEWRDLERCRDDLTARLVAGGSGRPGPA